MKSRTSQFIPLLIAFMLVLITCVKVLIDNIQESDKNTTHLIPDSVEYGIIALSIVALSILVKGNIWKYLFLVAVLLSFFPFLDFSHSGFAVYIGSLKIDFIAIPILISHVGINIDAFKIPNRNDEDITKSKTDKVNFFVQKFDNMSLNELEKMNEKDLVEEAQKARRIVINQKSL